MTRLAFYSLWLLVFTIPWQNAIVFGEFGTVTRAVGILAAGMAILSVLWEGRVRSFSIIQVTMTLFLVWAVISTAWTIDPILTEERVITYLQLFVLVVMMWQLAGTSEKQRSLAHAFVLGATIPGVLIVMARFTGQAVHGGRYQAANMGVNMMGATFALALAVACYLAATERKPTKFWFYTACMGLFQVGVFLTASRGATIASAVAWLLLPWVFNRLSGYKKASAVIFAGVLAVAALAVVPRESFERLGETGQQIESGSFSRRGPIWEAGWEVFQKQPIVGVGVGAFQRAVSGRVDPTTTSPHNVFVSIGVELGLVGLALFGAMLLLMFLGALQLPRFDRRFALILLTVWMMSALISNCEYRKDTWFVFGLLATSIGSRVRLRSATAVPQSVPAVDERGYAY